MRALNEQDVFTSISRAALGSEPVDDVFPEVGAAFTLPVLITARLLLAFCPQGKNGNTLTRSGTQSTRPNTLTCRYCSR
jgi:hypothetical protein